MNDASGAGLWARLPVTGRAIVCGLAIGLGAANVWPLLLTSLGVPAAVLCELGFLGLYLAWARGAFPPASTSAARRDAARAGRLSRRQWAWGLTAAVAFAIAVHAAIVLLFRLVPYPAAAFHAGYDFSFIPPSLRLAACAVSALSAGVCEEVGFRGYMQRPIERRHGPWIAILVSSVMFTLVHLNKDWSVVGMVPIVFGAGLMLGLLAWASGSLVFCMVGHTIMDVGLFVFWWTQIAGVFAEWPIFETGVDAPFLAAAAAFAVALATVATALVRLARMRPSP